LSPAGIQNVETPSNGPMFRLDRFMTLHLYSPISGVFHVRKPPRIPILMYHGITNEPETRRSPYYWNNTSPHRFGLQMRYLHENNYRVVPLRQLNRCLERLNAGEKPPVVLTFDDGYRDFYSTAFPVLRRYGFGASVFLPTDLIGADRSTQRYLTWHQVLDLHREGVEFGSHTLSHPRLVDLPLPEIEREVRASKIGIENRIGAAVESFSFPCAFPQGDRRFTGMFANLLRECGYRYAVTTVIGRASRKDDRHALKRLPINDGDDEALFRAKLEGNYDWLRPFQYTKRRIAGCF
jgi:peptidoglycan/xylan/chitin deacetylase (PgdA/CDA1 family)